MKWLLAVALTWLAGHAVDAATLEVNTTAVGLHPESAAVARVGGFSYRGGLVLSAPDRRFGGLSGLTLAPGTLTFVAVSDHGFWFRFRAVLDWRGWLVGIAGAEFAPLLGPRGRPVEEVGERDAEAVERDGKDYVVSFERRHRLWRYRGREPFAALPVPLRAIPDGAQLLANKGIEALARLRDGRLVLVAEDARDGAGDFRGWLVTGGTVAPLSYAATGLFQPTDFAVLPSGDLLSFTPLGGLAARIQLIDRSAIRAGARLEGREVARLAPPLTVDNFEALAVHPTGDDGVLVFLLSDDNYNPLQRTLLLAFRLAD